MNKNEKSMEYDIQKAAEAQKLRLKQCADKNSSDPFSSTFAMGSGFAPSDGRCYCCGRNIYGEGGISVEETGQKIVTGCPFCHRSFVE